MENNFEDKTFFRPGDVVTLRQDIPNKPTMVVLKKENLIFNKDLHLNSQLRGIKCRWFSNDLKIQEATFNTKDLIKL